MIKACFKSKNNPAKMMPMMAINRYDLGWRRLRSLKVRYLIWLTIRNASRNIIKTAAIAGISPLKRCGKQ